MTDMTTLGFALILVAALAAQTTLLLRVMGQRLGGFEARMNTKFDGKIDALDAKIDSVANRLEQKIDLRYENIDQRLTALESDMHIVKKHLLHVA